MSSAMGFTALVAFVASFVVLVPLTIALVMLVPMILHLRGARRATVPVEQAGLVQLPEARWTNAA